MTSPTVVDSVVWIPTNLNKGDMDFSRLIYWESLSIVFRTNSVTADGTRFEATDITPVDLISEFWINLTVLSSSPDKIQKSLPQSFLVNFALSKSLRNSFPPQNTYWRLHWKQPLADGH